MRLSRISKLAGAILIGASLSLVGVWQQALTHLAIGGNTYTAIVEAKDLVADVLPPPQYVIEPYLLATLALQNPQAASLHQAHSQKLKIEYDERHSYWSKSSIDSQSRNLLLGETHPPAAAFWKTLFEDFYPALKVGNRSQVATAYESLSKNYAQHRTAVDKVVARANNLVAEAEDNSKRQRRFVGWLTGVFSMFMLALVCGCVWALGNYYSSPIQRLQGIMCKLSGGNFDVAVPYTSRADEIGGMARSLLVFSEEGRRKRELARQNQTLNEDLIERTTALGETLDNMAQGIVLMRDGKIVLCNQNAMTLLEVGSEAEVSQKIVVAIAEASDAAVNEEKRTLPLGQTRRDIKCASGRMVEIRRNIGSHVGDVYTISDVSMLKRRQFELEGALATAQAAIEARSRFFSTVSHEMRTPLNGVIGSLELLRGQSLSSDQNQLVELGLQSCDALLAQIGDVLDFSKMEAGKLELNPVPIVIDEVVKSAMAVMAPVAAHRLTKLQSEFKGSLPVSVVADGSRLRQVLLNFLSNALKFTRGGTVTVRVRRTGGTIERPELEFAVLDTGPGIPPERLPMLFKEFSMVHAATIETSGTGLGLAISKRLVETMGGNVGVESVEGLGSVFWFRIALPIVDPITLTGSVVATTMPEEGRSLRILLVDDNLTNRLIGSRLLARAGHQVETANNGREAVEIAARGALDVIFMDVSMPEMDGIEATRQIRLLPEPLRSVRIIALTANAIRGDRERFLAAGMDDYLTKPLRPVEIQDRLRLIGKEKRRLDTASPAVPASLDTPLLDLNMLEMLSECDPGVLVEVLKTYCIELDRRLSEFEVAFHEADSEKLKTVAHAIAGASASTGATLLAARSRQAEQAYLEGDLEAAMSAARGIPELVRRTQEACRIRLGAMAPEAPPRTIAA